jgi:hypothetical protein
MHLLRSVKRCLVSEDGATSVEYFVIVCCTIILCICAIQAAGRNASTVPSNASTQVGEP